MVSDNDDGDGGGRDGFSKSGDDEEVNGLGVMLSLEVIWGKGGGDGYGGVRGDGVDGFGDCDERDNFIGGDS